MKVLSVSVTALGVNTYFCYDGTPNKNGKKICVVVDPGGEPNKLINFIIENNFEVAAILLTHGHFDHIGAVEKIRAFSGAKVMAHRAELVFLENPAVNLSSKYIGKDIIVKPDVFLGEAGSGDMNTISFGDCTFRVIHTPGHSPGGICLYSETDKILLSGDTLFYRTIGRTDLGFSSKDLLVSSILKKLYTLPDDVIVYPGHGQETSIGYEKNYNMEVRG